MLGGRPDGVLVLAYHNIRPDDAPSAGDRPLHLSLSSFRDQLDRLSRSFEVIPLEQLLEPSRNRRPRAVITFDDAYQGAMTLGVPELAARGLSATVFVTPAFLGGRSFWWDALAGAAGLAEAVRGRALEELRGEDDRIRSWAMASGQATGEPPGDCRGATEDELSVVAASPGITLGSHTWSHPNLARLEPTRLADELERPLVWLRERFERVIPWLSYPYGRWSDSVAAATRRAGYRAALRVDGGWYRGGEGDLFSLPRLNVPAGISGDGFSLRLAGLFCR
jgi:peptidoglycan/xylan/chitin deacetylase (PgdA/CDA1 family)